MIRFAARTLPAFPRLGRGGRAVGVAVALGLCAGALPLWPAAPAAAQSGGLFTPVAYVNGKAVTRYEVEQRRQFLTLLRQPGDLDKESLQGIIDDRLRNLAAAQAGLKLTPEDVRRGMDEFAGRTNLSTDDFIKALSQGGVSIETFRDFVTAQITWRELVRAKYVPTVKITDVEVDRALAAMDHKPAVRVLLSELVIPVEGDPDDEIAEANRIRAGAQGEAAFAAAARDYSASQTAGRGGKLDWMPVSNLPPDLARQVMALAPGQVTPPIPVPNAVVLLQLRAIADAEGGTSGEQTVDYAEVLVPDGPDAAGRIATIRARVDECNDLYTVYKGQPQAVARQTQPSGKIPRDVALQLAQMDPGEISTALRRGGAQVVLMLCARNPVAKDAPTREDMRRQLVGQRLGQMAEVYMSQLRSEAIIRKP